MFIRILSDLHTEFAPYEVEKMPEDQETILILAGDCGLFKHVTYAEFVQNLAGQFHIILLVPGNHEFYAGKMHSEQDKFEARVDRPNVYIIQNTSMEIDGVLFLGGTLWTSFRNGNPIVMMDGQNFMNDYKKIRVAKNGYRKLRAIDVLDEHTKTRNFIFDMLEADRADYENVVVITHHAPSRLSIPEAYAGDSMNDVYVNDFEYWIENVGPDLWFHGHTHSSMDYELGDTRVICNPRGYNFGDGRGNENEEFNPTLRLTL